MIECFAAFKAKAKLKKFHYAAPHRLGALEVLIKVSHCGICHSDIHLIDNDWGNSEYPLVPGHEIVGTVEKLGRDVQDLCLGQRVGVGWQSGSCMDCEWCARGEENLCADSAATAVGRYGGFAEKVITDSRFAFPVPEALASQDAAPLLCGGITVYSPLRRYVRPRHKVGVVGVGGLGHLALQFAKAFGCETTAFSHTSQKEARAMAFGAARFVSSTDIQQLKSLKRSFDFLLTTVNVKLDWERYLDMLRPDGRLIVVGAVAEPLEIPAGVIISGQKGVVASVIGGRPMIREMLSFAARHHIRAETEVLPLSEVNTALDRVRQNKVRYRMVLEI
jgi:uncharacterized zinc-type alcohol dehydrogenase-like protein